MVDERVPVRRRLGAHGSIFRRRRVFARPRESLTYEEIADEEGLSVSRVRQIASEELQKRSVDSGADHAKLQLDRLAPVTQLAAEAVAAGDVTAITPYLKMLDRLDGCQTVAGANQVYDGEARKKLLDEINCIADNLGIDEIVAAAREHLKKIGEIPDEPGGRGEGADETDPETLTAEANGLEEPHTQAETSPFFGIVRNPLKGPDSKK
jgi:hypothetical protein